MSEAAEPYALVTGASSGIGRAFAARLATEKVNLIVAARNRQALEELATELQATHKVTVRVWSGDLSQLEETEALFHYTQKETLNVEYLINSAGFGGYGQFITTDWQQEQAMIELNVTALTYLSKMFSKVMAGHGRGRIVNLASTAAFVPGPDMAVYYASKAYVLSLSQAIAEELANKGVTVTALCPGPTVSGFAEAAKAEQAGIFRGKLPTAEQVAAYGFDAMKAGKRVAIYGVKNRILVKSAALAPRSLVTRAVRKAQR